ALLNRRYDVILAGMSITDERRQTIDFTSGYATTPGVFVALKDNALSGQQFSGGVKDQVNQLKEALAGKTVGVQTGTIHQNFLEDELKGIQLRAYPRQEDVNLDLVAGRIDALLADYGALG